MYDIAIFLFIAIMILILFCIACGLAFLAFIAAVCTISSCVDFFGSVIYEVRISRERRKKELEKAKAADPKISINKE